MGAAKKGIYVFAGIILSLFAVTTAYFAVSVTISLKNGPARAERDFTRISQDVNSVLFFDFGVKNILSSIYKQYRRIYAEAQENFHVCEFHEPIF